jgi:cell division septation protein DedD
MVKSIAIRPDGSIAAASEVASLEAQARIGFLETGTPVRAEIAAAAAVTPEPVGEPAPTRTPVAVAAVTPAPIVEAPAPIAEPLPAESTVIARTPSTQPARTAAGTGAYFVQLAASPSEDEARNLMQKLQIKLGDNLGRRDLLIQEGAVKDKAVYRVRVGALSREDANTLCNRLKSLNACFVAKD